MMFKTGPQTLYGFVWPAKSLKRVQFETLALRGYFGWQIETNGSKLSKCIEAKRYFFWSCVTRAIGTSFVVALLTFNWNDFFEKVTIFSTENRIGEDLRIFLLRLSTDWSTFRGSSIEVKVSKYK
jgi:hypothetical protein